MLDVVLRPDNTALGVCSAIRTIFLSNGNESGLAVTLLAVAIRSLTLSLSRERFCFV
jgi:ABC-type proline/glycine betaine transport system permease subunit